MRISAYSLLMLIAAYEIKCEKQTNWKPLMKLDVLFFIDLKLKIS